MRRPKSLAWSVAIIGILGAVWPLLAALLLLGLVGLVWACKHERRAPIFYDATAMRAAFDEHEVLTGAEVVRDAA